MRSALIYSDEMASYELSGGHPYDPSRVRRMYDLCWRYELFNGGDREIVKPGPVQIFELCEVHGYGYLEMLKKASEGRFSLKMLEYGIGTEECPTFPGLFDFVSLCAGATVEAGVRVMDMGYDFAFNPLGGFHHAGRSMAEGFCYVNDVCLVARRWAERGLKVMVIDIDAHHGNGTQDFFYDDPRVLTLSIHESGETLYPWGGGVTEIGEGKGLGYNVNVPLLAGSDDEVFLLAFSEVVPPLLAAFAPDIVIGVMGVDTFATDPLTNLKMTNNAYIQAAREINRLAPRWIALGAGGYNVDNVVRGWTLLWAAVNGLDDDDAAATVGGAFMDDPGLGISSLMDRPVRTSGPEKLKLVVAAQDVVEYIHQRVFPIVVVGG